MNAVVVRKVPSSTDSLFNHRRSKHVVNYAVVAIWIGRRRFIIRTDCMQIIEMAFSEYKVNVDLILAVSFVGIKRKDNFVVVLLKCLNKVDDVADKLSVNIWLSNSRRKHIANRKN